MPNRIQTMLKPISRGVQSHISKRVADGMFDAKILLGSAIALDVYSNGVDYVQIGKNKNINKHDKKYLQAYKLTNGAAEGMVQLIAGAILLNNKTQEYLLKVSKKFAGMPVNPSNLVKNNFRILTTLVGSVLIAKRIIAPLIVTPLTTYVRKNIDID